MSKPPKKIPAPKTAPTPDEFDAVETADVDTSTESNEASAPAPVTPALARAYKGALEVDHDLYKLTVSKMLKNVSWSDVPEIVQFEHCHMFHTVDSGGKRQGTSSAIGGHVHEVEVVSQGEGKAPALRIGPPRKWVVKKQRGGGMTRVLVPIVVGHENDEAITDTHTHGAEYLGSERIKTRQLNAEAAKAESAIRSRTEPAQVPGIHAR